MQLVIRQDGGKANRLEFAAGPIHIGRGAGSQVFLGDTRVSRQHAVIFATPEGDWILEDLDSANKTYLNDSAIHRARIKTGDIIRIADFTIEVLIDSAAVSEKPTHLEDTLVATQRTAQVITRDINAEHGPDIKVPLQRAKDFLEATEDICKANGLDQVLQIVLRVMFRQFDAQRVWCALRSEPEGPMTSHTGKTLTGESISLGDIALKEKITYAVDSSVFLLFPGLPAESEGAAVGSAMIAPILDPDGCFGTLYLDNARDKAPYTLSDLDYLMLLAIHTAAIVENF
ncbi:MAG: FHA domain-containing protein [Planctomycetota bacterium]